MQNCRIVESRSSFVKAALATVVIAVLSAVYPIRDTPPAVIAEPQLDCPIPVSEGETWITRRWIQRGELKFECTHVFGFPEFDLPLARKVGLIP